MSDVQLIDLNNQKDFFSLEVLADILSESKKL